MVNESIEEFRKVLQAIDHLYKQVTSHQFTKLVRYVNQAMGKLSEAIQIMRDNLRKIPVFKYFLRFVDNAEIWLQELSPFQRICRIFEWIKRQVTSTKFQYFYHLPMMVPFCRNLTGLWYDISEATFDTFQDISDYIISIPYLNKVFKFCNLTSRLFYSMVGQILPDEITFVLADLKQKKPCYR